MEGVSMNFGIFLLSGVGLLFAAIFFASHFYSPHWKLLSLVGIPITGVMIMDPAIVSDNKPIEEYNWIDSNIEESIRPYMKDFVDCYHDNKGLEGKIHCSELSVEFAKITEGEEEAESVRQAIRLMDNRWRSE